MPISFISVVFSASKITPRPLTQALAAADLLKSVAHEHGQVVVEVLVDDAEVVLKVRRELLDVVKDLPQVLLHQRQDARELDIADACDQEVGHRIVLVADKQRKLCLVAVHYVAFPEHAPLVQLDLPVDEHSFQEKVAAYHELNNLISLFALLWQVTVSKGAYLQDLAR